jgi:hypothetical protein
MPAPITGAVGFIGTSLIGRPSRGQVATAGARRNSGCQIAVPTEAAEGKAVEVVTAVPSS